MYCDRCKKLFSADQSSRSKVIFEKYNEPVFDGDLCHKCQDRLEDFLEKKK